MPSRFSIIKALALYGPAVSASQKLWFHNACPHDLYFWVARANQPAVQDHHYTHVASGDWGVHFMNTTQYDGGGPSIKIRDLPHFTAGPAGIVQAEYYYGPNANLIYYDLSIIDCDKTVGPEDPMYCPFVQGGIKMWTSDSSCPIARCLPSEGECKGTYEKHGSWDGEPTWACSSASDIYFHACVESAAPQSYGQNQVQWHQPEQWPKPEYPTPDPPYPKNRSCIYPDVDESCHRQPGSYPSCNINEEKHSGICHYDPQLSHRCDCGLKAPPNVICYCQNSWKFAVDAHTGALVSGTQVGGDGVASDTQSGTTRRSKDERRARLGNLRDEKDSAA